MLRVMLRRSLGLLCLVSLGCSTAEIRPIHTEAPQPAPSAPPEPIAATQPDPEPTPAPPSFEPPCQQPGACPDLVVLADRLSPFATPDATTPLVTAAPNRSMARTAVGRPVLANPHRDHGTRAQLVCSNDDVTAQVFVDSSALKLLTRGFVVATPEREPAPSELPQVGISLIPGVPVEVQESVDLHVRVAVEDDAVHGTGWVAAEAIGESYQLPEGDPRSLPHQDRMELGFVDLKLRATPGGTPFVTLDGPVVVQRLGKPKRGYTLVAANWVLEERTYAVGWIKTKAIKKPKPGVPGGVLGGIIAPRTMVEVPAGAVLRSSDGEPVAVVHKPTKLECTARCKDPAPRVRLGCVTDLKLWVDAS